MKDEEVLSNLGSMFPSIDKLFLEDVFVSSNKDFDKTVDQLLSMGVELDVAKKEPQKPQPTPLQPSRPVSSPTILSPVIMHTPHAPPQFPPHAQAPSHIPSYPPLNNSINMNPPIPQTSAPPLTNSVSYPTVPTMFNVPATPPPINTSSAKPSPTSPTAPPSKPADGSVETKRLETLKGELSLEYQRINDTHKYNLELQQKLEQLRDYTTAEQKKLDEQRVQLQEDKRNFTEELTNRFKAMQDEHARLKDQLQKQEQDRIAAMEAEAEVTRRAKEARKQQKEIQRQDEERQRQAFENQRLYEAEQEKNAYIEKMEHEREDLKREYETYLSERDYKTNKLEEYIAELQQQLENASLVARNRTLEPLTALAAAIIDGVHSSSSQQPSGSSEEDKMKDFHRRILHTIATSLDKRTQRSSDDEEPK